MSVPKSVHGRAKGSDVPLDQVVQIRITKDERRALAEIAQREEQSLASVIRGAILREIAWQNFAPAKRGEQADRIRMFCKDNFIEPARARDLEQTSIRVGDVGKAMGLTDRPAAIASAIWGDKFLALANVEKIQVSGPPVGMERRFHFRLK
jgi:hypothetical protein